MKVARIEVLAGARSSDSHSGGGGGVRVIGRIGVYRLVLVLFVPALVFVLVLAWALRREPVAQVLLRGIGVVR